MERTKSEPEPDPDHGYEVPIQPDPAHGYNAGTIIAVDRYAKRQKRDEEVTRTIATAQILIGKKRQTSNAKQC